MDRRHFLQTLLTAPALTPVLLAARETRSQGELYLICDEPQEYLSFLLAEAHFFKPQGRTFTFLTPHPRRKVLEAGLIQQGWRHAADPARAHLCLSFRPLEHTSRPSFTFVREGRIWDVRSRRLRTLWDLMGRRSRPSTSLTTAGLHSEPQSLGGGNAVALYHKGCLIKRLPLNRAQRFVLPGRENTLAVQVANGRAWIAEASCRHQICRLTPPASLTGERIICAPNFFFLEIEGKAGIDTVIG